MREILFRGKVKNTNEWQYGDLRHWTKKSVGIHHQELYTTLRVIPETVGQYTGLTANGKKIFEGDIVKYKNTDGIKFNGVALTVIGKVVYNEKNASFAVSGKDEIGAKHYDYFPIKNIEVVGNIHDNPELLEVK